MQFVMYTSKLHLYQHSFFITYISKHAFPITVFQNITCKCAKSPPRHPTGALPLDPNKGLPTPEPPDCPVFILRLSGDGNSPSPKIRNRPKIRWDRRTRHEFMAGWHWQNVWSRFAFTV